MSARILDGKKIAQHEREQVARNIQDRLKRGQRAPGLAVILVGGDSASQVYVKNKRNACKEVGIDSHTFDYSADVSERIILEKIAELNKDPTIDGILIQLPLPQHISSEKVLDSVSPHKDVDGFHHLNVGKLALNQPGLRPCTPLGVVTLLSHTDLKVKGANACMVGASRIVGRPLALELLNLDATVTICHRETRNLPHHIQQADLLIVAIGQPAFIQGDWIKPDAVVIDIGTNRLPNGTLIGDVDFEKAKERASWITPVPGGVGPMTVSALLKNTLLAAELASPLS